ncbi:MAG TPA: hypothetical protein VKU19_20975 [Bryobacteraceae bacterium]|nr:hypothetical protein [Bryobacteraceae bacterium]
MHRIRKSCILIFLALASLTAVMAADQPQSKTKPAPSEPVKPANSQTDPKSSPKGGNDKDKVQTQKTGRANQGNSAWRPQQQK